MGCSRWLPGHWYAVAKAFLVVARSSVCGDLRFLSVFKHVAIPHVSTKPWIRATVQITNP